MDSAPLPLLLEDGSRFDWCRAEYAPAVRVEPTRALVEHRLRGAPTLERLVADGRAQWATELRCPKTLYSRVDLAHDEEQEVAWAADNVDGEMFVIPGLLATKDFRLRPERQELSSIWRESPLDVRKGWWLARGTARRTRTLGQSLLRFHVDGELDKGRMRIDRDESDEDLSFHVHLAADIWPERGKRHVQVAALIGAFGQLGAAFGDLDGDEPHIVREIRRRLEDKRITLWTEPEYDPAQAATAIEPFHPTQDSSERVQS